MSTKVAKKKPVNRVYTPAELKRIERNTEEYKRYTSASHWLAENEKYCRFAVNNLLNHYKFTRYKNNYRYDLHSESFIAVLLAFPRYKPGLRGINSWLYTQIQFAIRKYIARKIEKHANLTAGYGDIAALSKSSATNPEDILELREELQILVDEGNKVAERLLEEVGTTGFIKMPEGVLNKASISGLVHRHLN